MLKRVACVCLSILVSFSSSAAEENPAANAALAERFAGMAQAAIAGKQTVGDADFRQAIAMLQAAAKLNPKESRYPRLLAEAQLQLRDPHAALESLRTYFTLAPDDRVVMVQIIDLYSAEMETADARLAYFRDLLGKSVPDEVKSRIAVRAAKLLSERGEQAEAMELVEKAIQLDELNAEALASKLLMTHATLTPVQRVALLLQMVRANPRQPELMSRLANELADNGMNAEASTWYLQAITLNGKLALPPDLGTFTEYCSALLLSDQVKFTNQTLDSVLAGLPTSPDAWLLRLLSAKRSSDPENLKTAITGATSAMLENIYQAHRAVMGNDSPTTKPSGELNERLPDLGAMVARVKQLDNPQATDLVARSLADLAWVQIYFAQQPQGAAPLIDALGALLPADNLTVPRLTGWAYLTANQYAEARVKLSAIADRDALAKLGLLRLDVADPANKQQVQTEGAVLLKQYGTGLLGANLVDGLREFDIDLPTSDAAAEIKAELDKFPKKWLEILDRPDHFYAVRAETPKVSHAYDEPMIATVEINNTGQFDLAVGGDGAIRPDLWFDLQARAAGNASIPNAAYDRLHKRYVLKRGESMKQQVRLDQYPKVFPAVDGNPIVAMQLIFSVVTNPVSTPGGSIAPGPAGQRVALRKVIERAGMPFVRPETQQKVLQSLTSGTPEEKMRTVSVLSTLASAWSNPEAPEELRANARKLIEAIDDLRGDPIVPVRAWTMFRAANIRSTEPKAQGASQMAQAEEWEVRMLGAAVAQSLPKDQADPVLNLLVEDKEPVVRDYARATLEVVRVAATQPAATQPTTEPVGPLVP